MNHPVSKIGPLKTPAGFFKFPALKAGCQDQRVEDGAIITLSWCPKRQGFIVQAVSLANKKPLLYWLAFGGLNEARKVYCTAPNTILDRIQQGEYNVNLRVHDMERYYKVA